MAIVRIIPVFIALCLWTGCARYNIRVPSNVVRIHVYSPYMQHTNRTFTSSADIQRITTFIEARTNGWQRRGNTIAGGFVEAWLVVPRTKRERIGTFGALSDSRFNCGWWLTRRATKNEIAEFLRLVGEDYRTYFPKWELSAEPNKR